MIKLVLLTGFLGAGKTTLLQEVMNSYKEYKVGIIVNEFGEVNVDARLVEQDGIKMAELTNGSIFCACIKDKFVDSLIEMSYKDLDYLFIEASGLADPANMVQILEGIRNNILNEYDYCGSICVADGETFAEMYDIIPAITSQVEFCGAVIVNKGDLVDEAKLEETVKIINELNPEAEIYVTSYCRINVKDAVSGLKIRDIEARDTSNTYETRPVTFVLKGIKKIPMSALKIFLDDIAGSTYRIKGFADTDVGNIEISAVGNNIYLTSWDKEIERTEIIIISSVGFKLLSIITDAIEKYLKGIVTL